MHTLIPYSFENIIENTVKCTENKEIEGGRKGVLLGKSCSREGHESDGQRGLILPVLTRKLHFND